MTDRPPASAEQREDARTPEERPRGGFALIAHNPLEAVVIGLSAVLLIAAVVALVLEGIYSEGLVDIRAEPGEVRYTGGRYYVPIQISNDGDKSIQSVEFTVTLERAGQVVEESQVTLDWLPGYSRRSITAVFTEDPEDYDLIVAVGGYTNP